MTVITLDVDKITIEDKINQTKEAIMNNDPIDKELHVVIVVSNPCLYKRRYELALKFIRKMLKTPNIVLYIVELAYGGEDFYVTQEGNPRHLQLSTQTAPLWHKENMINLGVRKLLPADWRAVAWIDADVEFDSPTWPLDTLKILNGYKDVVQLFSHAVDMDSNENTLRTFSGFGYNYERGKKYVISGPDYWHPGFAWACTRRAYERMGGLYEVSILGSGDHNMCYSYIFNVLESVNANAHPDYKETLKTWQTSACHLRLGYVPGVIRHFYHGNKKNRKYRERWQILVKHAYSPKKHITTNADGLLVPTKECPQGLLDDIKNYFQDRNEDEL
jgi:hypothetical protein